MDFDRCSSSKDFLDSAVEAVFVVSQGDEKLHVDCCLRCLATVTNEHCYRLDQAISVALEACLSNVLLAWRNV